MPSNPLTTTVCSIPFLPTAITGLSAIGWSSFCLLAIEITTLILLFKPKSLPVIVFGS